MVSPAAIVCDACHRCLFGTPLQSMWKVRMSQVSETELLQHPLPGDSSGLPPIDDRKSPSPTARQPVKKLIRRQFQDRSQWFRHGVQAAFAMLNLWLGIQFILWARYYESAGRTLYVSRPAGVEGWLPIAGMMNTKYLLVTRRIPQIHPAAMFLFLAFLLSSLLLKKAFCSWLCPIGTLSELLWNTGQKLWWKNCYRIIRYRSVTKLP